MASITPPLTGCVRLQDLTGDLIWYVTGPTKFEAAAFRGDTPGCDPTTHHQRPLEIDGGTDALDTLAVGEVLAIRWHWQKQDDCGRHQIDIHDLATDEMVALVIDSGRVCEGAGVVITPHVPTVPTPVPEPASLLLLGGALTAASLRRRFF